MTRYSSLSIEGRALRVAAAGVGAACGDRLDLLPGDLRERLLEVILHPAAGRLRLPAAEGGAVVFDTQGDAHGGEPGRVRAWPVPGPGVGFTEKR